MTKPRLLHAMLRVSDLERSLDFYREFFDVKELRRIHLSAPTRTLVFLAAASAEADEMQLELWHEPDGAPTIREAPDARSNARRANPRLAHSGHVGIGVSDIADFIERLRARGVPILQEPAALRAGGRIIALIADPDGHEIELLS